MTEAELIQLVREQRRRAAEDRHRELHGNPEQRLPPGMRPIQPDLANVFRTIPKPRARTHEN